MSQAVACWMEHIERAEYARLAVYHPTRVGKSLK
jgi:hypothetical protein